MAKRHEDLGRGRPGRGPARCGPPPRPARRASVGRRLGRGSLAARKRRNGSRLDERVIAVADSAPPAVWALQEAEGRFAEAQAAARRPSSSSVARSSSSPRRARSSRRGGPGLGCPRSTTRSRGSSRGRRSSPLELERRKRLDAAEGEYRGRPRRAGRPRTRAGSRRRIGRPPRPRWRRCSARSPRTSGTARGTRSAEVGERRAAAESRRAALAEEVERLDATTAPLADRRAELERERHGLRAPSPSSRRRTACTSAGATYSAPGSRISRRPPARGSWRPIAAARSASSASS